jgi:hypothetical protein
VFQQRRLPPFTRLRNWLSDRTGRDALEFEWIFSYDVDGQYLEIRFFVERVPGAVDLWAATGEPIYIDGVSYRVGDDYEPIDYGVESFPGDNELRMRITPASRVATTHLRLHLKDRIPEVGSRVSVKVVGHQQDDLRIANDAHGYAQAGDFAAAIDLLNQYAETWKDNPTISYWLSDWYQRQGRLDQAEQCAVRAALTGDIDVCAERYRAVQGDRYPRTIKQIRALQEQAQRWSIGGHHGLVVLERSQQFTLGLNDLHLSKCRNLIEVRRPAAARMLSELRFAYSTAREYVLFTRMRIIHVDDTEEEVPIEHFTVSDQEGKNIFITVEDEKEGHWILPDLAAGDVIDWAYHLLCRDHGIDGKPHMFILTGPFDIWVPTFRGIVEFAAPTVLPVRYSVRNGDCAKRHTVAHGMETTVFEGERFIPTRRTGFDFENNYLNPMVVCASDGVEWSDVIPEIRGQIRGQSPSDEELPEPLASLVDGIDDKELALEHAFYWIRDTLKYATIRSGVRNIGQEDRARRIVESGVGNCSDKSYLLSLVCERLGVPYEFLSISTKNGVLIEDMPADQFDHVFIRAKPADRWVYLDAASPMSTFGSAPAWCQGMQVLAIDDRGTVITVPVDPPDVNAIEISETFDTVHAGRVHGQFDFRAHGQCARLIDERWKRISLAMDDPQESGQEALCEYLPASAVLAYARGSADGAPNAFHISGQHSRGPLVPLGNDGKMIATLHWEVPFLPVSYWRTLKIHRLFVVVFPTTVRLQTRLAGDLYRRVEDVSRLTALDGPVCSIEEQVEDSGSAVTVCRTIVFKNKYTRGDDVNRVPESLERIEEALQLVVSIDATAMRTP